jgi:hypothetical protein
MILPKEHVLFLNRSLEYLVNDAGPGDGVPGTDDPLGVAMRGEHRLTLTGTSMSAQFVEELPSISEVAWTLPRSGLVSPIDLRSAWTNRDLAVFGHLLGLAGLRWKPGTAPPNLPFPAPGDFLTALINTYGRDQLAAEFPPAGASWPRDWPSFTSQALSVGGVVRQPNVVRAANAMLESLRLAMRQTDPVTTQLGGGFHAATFAARYEATSRDDLVNRNRVLKWPGLPAVDGSNFTLSDPDPGTDTGLTYPADGFVMSHELKAGVTHNLFIRKDLTRLSVVTPDVEVPYHLLEDVAVAGSLATVVPPRYAPVDTSLLDLERLLTDPGLASDIAPSTGLPVPPRWRPRVTYVIRQASEAFVASLAMRVFGDVSPASLQALGYFRNALGQHRLKLRLGPDNPGAIPSMNVVPDGMDSDLVKAALVLKAHDRVGLTRV